MTPLLTEMKEFRDSRVPMRDSVSFWKVSGLTRLTEGVRIDYLQHFSVICRHRKTFQWGRHAANKTTKENVAKYNEEVVYIRYEKKYRKRIVW